MDPGKLQQVSSEEEYEEDLEKVVVDGKKGTWNGNKMNSGKNHVLEKGSTDEENWANKDVQEEENTDGEQENSQEERKTWESEGGDQEQEEEGKPEGNREYIPVMTHEEKEAMYQAVRQGNIDLLDDLLDLPGANINMTWFGQNLLMVAIRAKQKQMAEFLLDNNIDYHHKVILMDIQPNEDTDNQPKYYKLSCRQMAYEHGLCAIVDIIDGLEGKLWPFMQPQKRQIRLKRPLEEKLKDRMDQEMTASEEDEDLASTTWEAKSDNTEQSGRNSRNLSQVMVHFKDPSESESSLPSPQPELGNHTSDNDMSSGYGSMTNTLGEELYLTVDLDGLRSPHSTHRYKGTKSYFARKKISNQRTSYTKEQNQDKEQRALILGSYWSGSSYWLPQKGRNESEESPINKPQTHPKNWYSQNRCQPEMSEFKKNCFAVPSEQHRNGSAVTRHLSPWRDDPLDYQSLRKASPRPDMTTGRCSSSFSGTLPILQPRSCPSTPNKVYTEIQRAKSDLPDTSGRPNIYTYPHIDTNQRALGSNKMQCARGIQKPVIKHTLHKSHPVLSRMAEKHLDRQTAKVTLTTNCGHSSTPAGYLKAAKLLKQWQSLTLNPKSSFTGYHEKPQSGARRRKLPIHEKVS